MRSVSSNLRVCSGPMKILAGGPPFPRRVFRLGGCVCLSPGRPEGAFYRGLTLSTCDENVKKLNLPKSLSSSSHFMHMTFAGMGTVSNRSRRRDIDRFFRVLKSISRRQKYYRMTSKGCRVALCASYYGIAGNVCCCGACKGRRVDTMSVRMRGLSDSGVVYCPMVRKRQVGCRGGWYFRVESRMREGIP